MSGCANFESSDCYKMIFFHFKLLDLSAKSSDKKSVISKKAVLELQSFLRKSVTFQELFSTRQVNKNYYRFSFYLLRSFCLIGITLIHTYSRQTLGLFVPTFKKRDQKIVLGYFFLQTSFDFLTSNF